MAAMHRPVGTPDAPETPSGGRPRPTVVEPAGPRASSRMQLRARATRREVAGRAIVTWCAAYLALRWSSGVLEAIGQATLVSILWISLFHRAAQAFRAMAFAAGAYVAAAVTSIGGAVVLSALAYWQSAVSPDRSSVVLVALLTFAALGTWDFFVRRAATAPRRVLVVGGGPATARLLDRLDEIGASPFDVIAVVGDRIEASVSSRVRLTGRLDELPEIVQRVSPDLVVIAVQRGRPEVFGSLLDVAATGFQITGLPEIYEFTFGRLPVEELTPAWFMSVLHTYNRPANRLGKRTFDVVVALVGAIASLPLLPLIVLVVKRTRGPLLFRQQRVGEHGRLFTILKFRSMRVDAEVNGEARWAAREDDRIIPGGRLLRRLRFDELPQLWNVLRGEMSIVGPRPERPEFLDYLEEEVPFWSQRHLLKPGITGWAQIRADYAADALATTEKLAYDLWYLRHRSLLLDTVICLRTLPRMATFGGAR